MPPRDRIIVVKRTRPIQDYETEGHLYRDIKDQRALQYHQI